MSKNYRKFVAGTVTAAVVASAIAPAASAATFSDVDPASSHAEAIDALSEAGVINGYPDGTFKPGNSITRGQVAKMIARTIEGDGEVEQVFDDVPVTADEELVKAAQEVFEAGAITGANGKLMPANEITRQQMAKVLVEAFGLTHVEGAESQVTDLDKAYPDFREYIEILSENEVTNVEEFRPLEKVSRAQFASFVYRALAVNVITEVAELEDIKVMEGEEVELPETVEVTYANDTTAEVAVEWDEVDTSKAGEYTVEGTIEGTDLKASVKVIVEAAVPAVKEVKAINATQLVVKFNKEINAADATEAKFKLEDQSAPAVKVADDNKTVTLTYASVEGTDKVFTVEPVQTKADAKVTTERFVTKLTYEDTVDPTVTGVAYSYPAEGKATAKLTFSEPLTATGTVSVDGVVVTPAVNLATGEVSIENLEVGKSYKVDIVGATDKAGNIANPIVQNLTVAAPEKDESKPSASILVSGNKVIVQFSEEVTVGTVKINGTDYAAELVQDADDKTKYVLDTQAAGALTGVNFLNAKITVEGYKDAANNAGDKAEVQATLQADKTAPSLVSAGLNKTNDKLLLTFNDVVKAGDLDGTTELALKIKDGVHQTNSVTDLTDTNAKFGYDVDGNGKVEGTENNVVAINYGFTAKSTYSFELAKNVVADVYGNAYADTLTFAVTAPELPTTPGTPEAIVKFADVTVSGSALTVAYNKEMSDSALVASNYKLGGKVLPSNTQLKFVDSRNTVEITLPEGFVTANGTYVLEAAGLTDKDGNTLENGKATSSEVLKENVAPAATKVSAVDSKNLTVDFSEAIADNNSVTGVTVKVNGTAVETTTVKAAAGKLTVVTKADFALTDSISVEFKSANLVDANGNAVKDAVITK